MSEWKKQYLNQMKLSAQDPNHPNSDVAKLLISFIEGFGSGEVPCDFKEAALVLQESTSLYGKKVDNFHTMVTGLHNVLIQQEEDRLQNKGIFKEKAAREEKKLNWTDDISTEITPGKNLSALTRRNASKNPYATTKEPQSMFSNELHSFVPIDLLPLEDEEKGDIFYDTKGQPVGYANEFAINRCRVNDDGYLLFDTISPELVDIVDETTANNAGCRGYDTRDNNNKGYPPSSGCPSSAPNLQVPSSQESGIESSDISSGISVDMEKASINDLPPRDESPLSRKLYKLFPWLENYEEPEGAEGSSEEFVDVVAPIGKECTISLPASLRGEKPPPLEPIADFCARLFFGSKSPKSEDSDTELENPYAFMNSCFENNSTLCKRRDELYGDSEEYRKWYPICKEKKSRVSPVDSDENNSSDESGEDSDGSGDGSDGSGDGSDGSGDGSDGSGEGSDGPGDGSDGSGDGSDGSGDGNKDHSEETGEAGDNSDGSEGSDELNGGVADADGEPANPGLDFDDIKIFRPPTHIFREAANLITDDIPRGVPQETEPEFDLATDLRRIQEKETAVFRDNIAQFPHEEVSEKVRVWQKSLVPFLNKLDTSEKFDINVYGSRILEAFGNSNRRQTMTFRQFCEDRGLEKSEAHRYFMALLPLANMGSVELSNEPREGLGEEDDDIVITLLSRKMHHVDLEEFGHTSGEH